MWVVAVVLASGFAFAGEAPVRDPEAIMAAVASRGARAVINEIWSDDVACRALLKGVRSARRDWLRAAVMIQPGTDAGSSEELGDALARGLLVSPADVLPIVRDVWWKNTDLALCEFDWDSELPGSVEEYATRLEAALRQDKSLPRVLRDACAIGIAKTRHRVRRHKSEEEGRPTTR